MEKIEMNEINNLLEQGADFEEIVDTLESSNEGLEVVSVGKKKSDGYYSSRVTFNNGQVLVNEININKSDRGLFYVDE